MRLLHKSHCLNRHCEEEHKMGKSDDSISRRKNKKSRKKQEESKAVSNRVAAIIAAKKRRLSGKRRLCQGMCYSLPTPEDPFNDKHGKPDPVKKQKKNVHTEAGKMEKGNKTPVSKKRPSDNRHTEVDAREQKKAMVRNEENHKLAPASLDSNGRKIMAKLGIATPRTVFRSEDHPDCPSKFLMQCLNTIQKILQQDSSLTYEEDKPFFVDAWGFKFWRSYSDGEDVIEMSTADASVEQIAWVASTAADAIYRKDNEGQSFTSPFLLYLVPTHDKASKVRRVCKPLKVHGVHTVSLHPGASIEHQIHGLKRCEPEFLVSTPERLLELISSNAVDISGVSLMIIEGMRIMSDGSGYQDALRSIRDRISGNLQTLVFFKSHEEM